MFIDLRMPVLLHPRHHCCSTGCRCHRIPPPIVNHAHSSPILSRAGPPSSSLPRPRSPDPCAACYRFRALQTCRRPSSPDPPSGTPPSQGRTLHHECPDPSGDPISAPEADIIRGRANATGCATSRDGSASRSPPLRQTSLSGRPPSDPWGRRCKTRNPVGCIHATLSVPMDPLHHRRPLTAMLIHTCSHAR
jgi:hypothetical protein